MVANTLWLLQLSSTCIIAARLHKLCSDKVCFSDLQKFTVVPIDTWKKNQKQIMLLQLTLKSKLFTDKCHKNTLIPLITAGEIMQKTTRGKLSPSPLPACVGVNTADCFRFPNWAHRVKSIKSYNCKVICASYNAYVMDETGMHLTIILDSLTQYYEHQAFITHRQRVDRHAALN